MGAALPTLAVAQDAPEGFDAYLVYMANGSFDPNEPNTATGDQFYGEIMGLSEEEKAAELGRAETFFRDRFGLDFTIAEPEEGVKTVENASLDTAGFMADPRWEYRAYTVAGNDVPAEGWVVRDGGWMVVIGEGGATLTGTWGGDEGVEVLAGTFLVFGDYNIDTGSDPIIIHYESGSPIFPPGPDGIMAFSCVLSHPDWGDGQANGTVLTAAEQEDGTVKVSIRNVLTFPPR